jgi:acyl-CoA synthetase (NDP forming)
LRDLDRLFRPRTVAIIGASDKNPWSRIAAQTLADIGYSGPVHLVNRRGTPALGRETIQSCADAVGGIDAAFVAVPVDHMMDALDDMAAGDVRFGAVVTSGFAEVGADGAALQDRIFAHAEALGIALLGPNSLGFTNCVDGIALGAMPRLGARLPNPRVALVSQSGATAVLIAQAAQQYNISLSHTVAMGNEAMIDLADVVHFFVDDEATRAICIFAESIRNPAAFLDAAEKAHRANKPIVMLKVGVGELTAAVAQAHTGALVGDDKAFQAMCDAYNIVRVHSMEDLVIAADMLAQTGPIDPAKGFVLASVSGGACEIVADLGEQAGIPFPQFAPETREKLSHVLAEFGASHNPLDITGAAMARPTLYSDVIRILGEDGQFDFVGVIGELPISPETQSPTSHATGVEIGRGLRECGIKGALMLQTLKTTTEYGRHYVESHGLPLVTGGLDHGVRAIGNLWSWSRGLGRALPVRQQQRPSSVRLAGEREALEWLGGQGVPVIPQLVARTRDEAVSFTAGLGGPAVLKILSPDIAHKTEIGGVMLDLTGDAAVGDAYEAIMARAVAAKPDARIDGVLVSPMRSGGQELIVGIARDPSWGLVLAIGIGGIWVELLEDTQLRLLPVTEAQVVEALGQLKAARLLTGYRGSRPADLDRVAAAVTAICNAAIALGDDLETLEINPLLVDGDRVEALDALVIWAG